MYMYSLNKLNSGWAYTFESKNTLVQKVYSKRWDGRIFARVQYSDTRKNEILLPPVLSPPLSDADGQQYVWHHGEKHNKTEPAIEGNDKVDDSHSNVHQSGGYVE